MQSGLRHKIFWSLFAALAIAVALSGGVDRLGEASAEAAFKRALVTFAVSRALNGAISVAQGTELALEPAGVGVVLTLGQVLDPVNDLVERFSTVMLVATSSLGLQNLLLEITSGRVFDIGLGACALLVFATAWLPWRGTQRGFGLARRIFLVLVFLRFVIPLLIITSGVIFDVYLEDERAASVGALEGVQTQIEAMNAQPPPVPVDADASLMDRLGAMFDETLQTFDIDARIERLKTRVSDASEHIVNLIVIFVLQTILLPIAFVWLFVEILKGAARRLTGS